MKKSWRDLRIGDKIRILRVPHGLLPDTLRLYQRIVKERAILRVYTIDPWGHPVIEYSFEKSDGSSESHALAIDDGDVWEQVF